MVFGSWVFGLYYLYNGCWKDRIVNEFNGLGSSWRILWTLSKNALGGFYNYPNEDVIRFVAILQYFIGKILDLFLLGYIFNVIFEMSKKNKNGNKVYKVTIERQRTNQ